MLFILLSCASSYFPKIYIMIQRIFILLFAPLLLLCCKTKQVSQQEAPLSLTLENNEKILFLDSTQAAAAIVVDQTEDFFEHINILDMSIQMRKNYPPSATREKVVEEYKTYLQKDVESFNKEEISFMEIAMKRLYIACKKLNHDIFPKEIKLIKTKARHYGQSVYYTRDNCIVIPYNELDQRNEQAFFNVMAHELFHIYSRLNPEKRKTLYELIGFKSIGPLGNLKMVDSLKQRVLLNPDGVNYAQAIELKTNEKESFLAIPIILANTFEFNPERPSFFSYLAFDLYEIRPPYSRLIKVVSNNDGSNKKPLNAHPDFHRQIRDNTGYIIHPDEVLADNFIYLINKEESGSFPKDFSKPGTELLTEIEAILRK